MANLTNRVVHFEIGAIKPERAVKFYKSVFGWKIKKWESDDFDYWLVMTGKDAVKGAINGGLTKRKGKAKQSQPVNAYVCVIEVDDVDKTVKRIKKNGGKITIEPADMPQVGRLAYALDTEGNHFGIITSVSQ